MPRPLNYKKAADFSSNFVGITPAPQYSLNLTTKPMSVKSPRQQPGVISLEFRVKLPPTDSRLQTRDSPDYDLFDFNGCARVGKFLPDGLGLFFRDAFLHGLRSRF